MDTETTVRQCIEPDCEVMIDTDYDDYRYSTVLDGEVCWGCYESALQYASSAMLIEPDGAVTRYTVHDYGVMGEYGDDEGDILTRGHHSSSAWRGHYETRPVGDGWTELESGWTTGAWGDAIANTKRTFNEWAQAVIDGETESPFRFWIIADPTSNVFSTAISVYVRESDVDAFKAWAGEVFQGL